MANRYWVGDTGNWNDPGHWSTTSGGASGASVPSSTDDVFIDNNSGSLLTEVTVNIVADCHNFVSNVTADVVHIFLQNDLNVYGSFDLDHTTSQGSVLWQATAGKNVNFVSSATGNTVRVGNIDDGTAIGTSLIRFIFNGTGEWTITRLSIKQLTLEKGDLIISATIFGVDIFNVDTANTKSLTLGSSLISVQTQLNMNDVSGLTLSAGTSAITMTGGVGTSTFNGGDQTYYDVNISSAGAAGEITGDNTFHNLSITGEEEFASGSTQTATTFTAGSDAVITASTPGSQAFISADVAVIGLRVSVTDNHALGTGIPFDAQRAGIDGGNNDNWFFGIRARPIYLQ